MTTAELELIELALVAAFGAPKPDSSKS